MNFDFLSPALRERKIDISGVENAILDFLVRVEPGHLGELGLTKGTMKLVGTEEQAVILEHVGGLEVKLKVIRAASEAERADDRVLLLLVAHVGPQYGDRIGRADRVL